MRPTLFRMQIGRFATCAVASVLALAMNGQTEAQRAAPAVAQGASLVGGALPGGAILSSAVVSLTPAGGTAVTSPISEDGTFSFKGLKPGAYELRVSFPAGPRQSTDVSTSRQTPKTDFGTVMKAGANKADASKTKHDTAKNSIGNIRAREQTQAGAVSVAAGVVRGAGRGPAAPADTSAAVSSVSTMAGTPGGGAAAAAYAKVNINDGMPNRISMNVTTPKQNFSVESDGDPIVVQVGADGTFAGRASVQAQQGAEPASSGKGTPAPEPPPRPAGG